MSVYQGKSLEKNLSSILLINKDTFASLTGEDETSYRLNFSFSLYLNGPKNVSDYEKVRITVKRRAPDVKSYTSSYSNLQRPESNKSSNNLQNDPYLEIKPDNGIPRKNLPAKLANKVYSGLLMLRDLDKKDEFIERIEVPISSREIAIASNSTYQYTELVARNLKPERKLSRSDETKQRDLLSSEGSTLLNYSTSRVNPSNTLERINRELVSVTYPVTDEEFSKVTSESRLDNPEKRLSIVSKGKSPLFYDIVKYYLDDVPRSPEEEKSTYYDKKVSTKKSDTVELVGSVSIKKENRNQNLDVKFEIFKRGSNVIEETRTVDLYLPSLIESFSCPVNPPVVNIVKLPETINKHSLSVKSDEIVGGFNVYLKSVFQDKTVSDYKLIGTLKSDSSNSLLIDTQTNLTSVRVVSLDAKGKETNLFTDVVLGPGHKTLGSLVILPSHFGKNQIRTDVFGIPDDTTHVSLYRRDCTDNVDGSFTVVNKLKIRPGNSNLTFMDSNVSYGRVYEYYAVALSLSKDTKEEIPSVSNYVVIKNVNSDVNEKAINVKISNFNSGQGVTSFIIETSVSKSENERITETLKSQIGEMYEKYLSPSTNTSSPLGDSNGNFQYADLFFHEIVRTNIVTGERETFELVGDGEFVDSQKSQKNYNIKPIDKRFSYYYQVFTFRKNPLDLFKNFVARGQDEKGREWFYLPYKWRNTSSKLGKLYPDDKDGIPIIDAYENFTSESYGLTASLQVNSEKNRLPVSQANVKRIDKKTIKIDWEFNTSSNEISYEDYDSFVVMKVVNGVRSFVGRTQKTYIYHKLTIDDVGSIYYIVVPILSNFEIDSPSYTDSSLIYPEEIEEKSLVLNSFT